MKAKKKSRVNEAGITPSRGCVKDYSEDYGGLTWW